MKDKQQTPSVVAFRPASASLIRTLVEREHNQGLSGPRGLVGAKATPTVIGARYERSRDKFAVN